MFDKSMIDFDKLHGEIKSVLARQKELRAMGVKGKGHGNRGFSKEYEEMISKPWYKDHKESTKLSWEASYLSCRMTVLCSILAQAKGKLRHQSLDKKFWRYNLYFYDAVKARVDSAPELRQETQEKLIGDEWKQFLKEKKTQPEAAEEIMEQLAQQGEAFTEQLLKDCGVSKVPFEGFTKHDDDKGVYYTKLLEPVEPLFPRREKNLAGENKSIVSKIWSILTR